MRHFLFGYGSLISRESRRASGKTGETMPVLVHDMQRAWNVGATDMRMVGVGIVPKKGAGCNGVLIEIDETEIASFDKREIEGTSFSYDRLEIPFQKIHGLTEIFSQEEKVWAYVVNKPFTPSWEFPIVQSYIDVILSGCLDISDEFAIEFIRKTTGWEYPWCNDRNHPRYARHLKKVDFQDRIDDLLAKQIPLQFASRKNL
jgi:hypothetical protein